MKRVVLLGSLAMALAAVLACHPKEPKQAFAADPVTDDPAASSASSSGGASSGPSSSGSKHDDNLAPPPSEPAGKASKGEPTSVSSLASMMDGFRWGMSHADLTKAFTENGGIIWKDYDAKLARARVGPEMTAIEAEREGAKQAFSRSFIEFKDTPTGYDATGIRGEYTYRNREALMWITREGRPKRYFFFINDRLWKVYDEVPLAEAGPLGKSYVDAVNQMNAQLGAQGRIQSADPEKGIASTTVDWKDGSSHLRVVDRTGDRVVGVVVEDKGTLGNLASLRLNKAEDPTAIDPTIAAVTKGTLSDPNAAKTTPSGSAAGKKPPPKK
jgi:hypothetical protein